MMEITIKPMGEHGMEDKPANATYKTEVKKLIDQAEELIKNESGNSNEAETAINHLDMALQCLGFSNEEETANKDVEDMAAKKGSFMDDIMGGDDSEED